MEQKRAFGKLSNRLNNQPPFVVLHERCEFIFGYDKLARMN